MRIVVKNKIIIIHKHFLGDFIMIKFKKIIVILFVIITTTNAQWGLNGNAGTVDGTNFIGTTDDVPFNIRVNNQKAGRIDRVLQNTFYGYYAGNFTSTGIRNMANGYYALYYNTTGLANMANGYGALYSNTTGSYNMANGYAALYYNTTGQQNTANGYQALHFNKAGSNGTAVGANAMLYANDQSTAFTNYNVAVGYEALRGSITPANNTGNYNTATGYQTLWSNTTGIQNTANGFWALYSNTTGSANTAIGRQALYKNTTGGNNIAIGVDALSFNDVGNYNIATGTQSLNINTGSNNIAYGHSALSGNTTGGYNTAIGKGTLSSNITGNNNTALGNNANVSTSNLTNATAIGSGAIVNSSNTIQLGDVNVTKVFAGTGTTATVVTGGLQITGGSPAAGKVLTSDATGVASWQPVSGGGSGWSLSGNAGTVDGTNFIGTTDNVPFNIRVNNEKAGRIETNSNTGNTFYGYRSGNSNFAGYYNTANGYQALYSNTNGIINTAVGYQALYANTTGSNNTAFGHEALLSNTTGFGNTAIGFWALRYNNGGINTAVGYKALYSNTTAGSNTAIGEEALYKNTTGYYNTANGKGALYNNTGDGNTAIGLSALSFNTTGNENTAVGMYADVGTGNLTNATAIGHGATVNANNKVVIGNSIAGMVIGGFANWSNLSDGRFKENIKEDVPGLNFITKLRPVTYTINTRKLDEHIMQNMPDSIKRKRMQSEEDYNRASTKTQTGFVAQEVEQTAKEIGYTFDGVNAPQNSTDNYSIAYGQFVVPLVKAVQEQETKIEQQQKIIEQLTIALQKLGVTLDDTKTNNPDTIKVNELKKEDESNKSVPKEFGVSSYPNPFNPTTTIKVSLPKEAKLNVGVYDVSGRLVTTLSNNEQKSAGYYAFEFNGSSASSGAYFVQVQAGQYTSTQKIMLVK